ncbi:MAG TPA: ABC transporter permease [Polyangia bacterium]
MFSRKILAVAETELNALIRSKAFLISVLLVPVLIFGVNILQVHLGKTDTTARKFAVLDQTGVLYDGLAAKATARNALGGAPFLPSKIELAGRPLDQVRLELSDEVRRGDLFAFVELPAGVESGAAEARYYADNATYDKLPDWLRRALDEEIRDRRLAAAHVAPEVIASLKAPPRLTELGLLTRGSDGSIHPAVEVDMLHVIAPIIPPVLIYFLVLITMTQMMNTVLVEKMTRVSEVLLGSLSPFQLMAGKLLGGVGASMLLALLYVGGAVVLVTRMGLGGLVSPALLAWFAVFLVLALLLYGSVCMAIGAACNDLKDAQNLMLPVMLPLILPVLFMQTVMESPSGSLSVGLSLFPPATPVLMLLRVGLHPSPPAWQVALGVALTLAATVGCVWAAGRIFRVGLLMQGKSASLREMLRWIRAR